eukprot:1377049-Pleurochrysis_carterae.AAC.3
MGSIAKHVPPGRKCSTCVLMWTSTCHDDGPCQSTSPGLPTSCCAAAGNHQLPLRLAAARRRRRCCRCDASRGRVPCVAARVRELRSRAG